ncbi:MAG: aromatic ring-hydroxylating dioxygenase subunit alpha [Labilithrix sp.]|nr:aromatic ring-hydroxylating dioxygenase subunit alpha [Labilithrix sp.]MCW5813108.1 aromatic ring-hydroxylating dioxygenase subunit alpha [Labilithrix sp.]
MMRSIEQVLADYDADAPLERAFTIPGSWYTDPRVAEVEARTVFTRSWQLVGRADQLLAPGCYVTAEIAGEPIVVVRGQDGVLRAFFNVCRHHAAAVMTECAGKADRLRCPYHGWTYGLDGALRGVTELEGLEGFEREGMGLVPVRVAAWEQLVFVCLDPTAPSLEDWLGARLRAEVSALGVGALRFAGRREWTLACNWKVFVDNYLDGGYHVPFLHRGLNSVLSFKEYTIDCFDRVCLQASPVESGAGNDAMTASVRKGRAAYYWLYPNLMLNCYEGYLDTNLVLPLGHDRVKVVFDFYFDDVESEAARARNERSIEVSARIQDEDHAICESVQRGLGSRAYRAGRLSVRREAGEHLFHRLLAADLRTR